MKKASTRRIAAVLILLPALAAAAFLSNCTPAADAVASTALIRYEVTDTGGSAFITYGSPDYIADPAGAYYATPWSYEFTAIRGDSIFLYVQDTWGTGGNPATITLTVRKNGAVWDTYSWTNSSGSPQAHTINEGLL
jgi:hypothetical protein